MIAPTYTHPGANAIMLAISRALRKAVLYRRDAKGFSDHPAASCDVCNFYAEVYEAQADELRQSLASVVPPRNVYIADEERRELELLSLRRALVIGFTVFALTLVFLCAFALLRS